jgi:membrane associated rhomboid family serine protease
MWNNSRGRSRAREVNWAASVRRDAENADQVLFTLMAINVAVFILWHIALGAGWFAQSLMSAHFTVSAESILNLRVWTLLTSAFSQVELFHLLFNLLGMWVFGREVGHRVGPRGLVVLYVGGAVVASAAHVLYNLISGDLVPALGASGSVMALAVMFGAMFPNRTLMINFFFPVPAAMAVGLYVLLDVFGLFGVGGGGIANAAHLGGAAFGLAYYVGRSR